MAIGFQKRGLFGAPGFGTKNKYDLEQPMPMAAQEPKKPGFFGEGGAGRGIAGAIGDYLLQTSGMRPIYAPQQQYKQHFAMQQQLAEKKRLADREDYAWERNYDLQHPKPVNNDTVADYEFLKAQLGPEAAAEFLKNKANPPVYRVGADGQFYRVEVGQPQTLGASLPPGWTIQGQ